MKEWIRQSAIKWNHHSTYHGCAIFVNARKSMTSGANFLTLNTTFMSLAKAKQFIRDTPR